MTDEINDIIKHCKIGEEQKLTLATIEQNHNAGIALVSQARYKLDIVSRDLDHAIYDNEDFYNVVKHLATSGPKAKIRILIQDSDKAVKQGHRLVKLARKLSSFIEIRIQGKHFKEFNEAWLIVDEKAWIRRPFADKYSAEMSYSAARKLKDIGDDFETMWNEASNDPNFRQLSI